MQINKRIEEILPMGGHVPLDTTERKKMILSLLHDFSREVVGEQKDLNDIDSFYSTSEIESMKILIENSLRSEQLERADKMLGGE